MSNKTTTKTCKNTFIWVLRSKSYVNLWKSSTVILLPAHPASFAHNFVSGMQSFYFSESQDAIVLQTCHKKCFGLISLQLDSLMWETVSPKTHKPKIVNVSLQKLKSYGQRTVCCIHRKPHVSIFNTSGTLICLCGCFMSQSTNFQSCWDTFLSS